jgi:hypothetical protein
MELQVSPQPLDHVQTHIAGVIGAHHFLPGKFQDAADGIAQNRSPKMTDMESLVCIRMGKFQHDALAGCRPATKAVLFFQHHIHHAPGIFRRVKVQVEIPLQRINTAEAGCAAHGSLDLLSDLLGAQRYNNLFPRARFSRSGREKRSGNTPFPTEWDGFPLQQAERNLVRFAESLDFVFDGLLFNLEHAYL